MRVAVVGSGPAGVAAAAALIENDISVDVLDVGAEIEPEATDLARRLRDGNAVAEDMRRLRGRASRGGIGRALRGAVDKWRGKAPILELVDKTRLGSSFTFRDIEWGIPVEGAPAARSLARGGLSNIWGAASYPLTDADYARWPFGAPELAPHYRAAAQMLHLIEPDDDLAAAYARHSSVGAEVPLNPPAAALLEHWSRHRATLDAEGVLFGRARLAVRAADTESGIGCRLCGLCLYGCPYDSIYRADWTLETLMRSPSFRYLRPLLVRSFHEEGERVIVECIEGKNGPAKQLEYDALFLAAGTLSTLRIAVEAQQRYDLPVRLLDNDLYLVPFLRTARDGIAAPLHFGLNELALRLMTRGFPLHVQFYCMSDRILDGFGPLLSALPGAVKRGSLSLLSQLMLAFVYLPGDASARIEATVRPGSPVGVLSMRQQRSRESRHIVRQFTRLVARHRHAFGLYPLGPVLPSTPEGPSGGHLGGALPMRRQPGPLQTWPDGRLHGTRHVYVVDGAALPSLPSQNSTYTIMANSHRVGTRFARQLTEPIEVTWGDASVSTGSSTKPEATFRFAEQAVARSVVELDHHRHQYESSALTAAYHDIVLKRAVRVAQLRAGMHVLDHGCGRQRLRRALPPGVRYTGYDVVPELSDVDDPRQERYDVVFAMQVLMYYDASGLEEWADVVAGLTKRLVVMVPARNFLKDEVLDRLLGLQRLRENMVRQRPEEIYAQLSRRFSMNGKQTVFWMGELTSWTSHSGSDRRLRAVSVQQ